MIGQRLILSIFILFSIANVISVKSAYRLGELITKPLLMPLLILVYLWSTAIPNWFVIFALFCGFLGDVFLMNRRMFFMAGVLSFLIGHIFYIIALIKTLSLSQIPTQVFILIVPYIFLGAFVYLKLFRNLKSIKFQVLLYTIIILAMSFTSLLRIGSINSYQFWMPFLGSILFITSDSILAFNEFKAEKNNNRGSYVMLTYITAQFLIVAGFL